jgi:hypothetical protein
MTSGPQTNGRPASHSELRLRLKPQAPATGYVDGAWWPRSHDLGTELVTLANVLEVRLGRVERVAYALSMWDAAPRRIGIGDDAVRLEGFSYQDRNIVHVTGASRGRVSLLVVPPGLADASGHDAMAKAARRGNADRPEEILAAAVVPAPREDRNATRQGGNTR